MATGSAKQETSADATTRDSFIPLFSGQPADYKEWRKRIHIYYRKMGLTKRNGEAVLNIIGSLQGSAWRLVEDFNLDECEKESAFESIIKLLDGHFEYDTRVQLPSDFDGYFGLQRKPGQTLLAYVSDHAELHKKLEKHTRNWRNMVSAFRQQYKDGTYFERVASPKNNGNLSI